MNALESLFKNGIHRRPSANLSSISEKETELGVLFPDDYKNFLKTTNGYNTHDDSVEPSLERVENIDYLEKKDSDIIKIWRETGNESISNTLKKSIIIGGIQEEQSLLLIPISETNWKYWKFASWIPGEIEYQNLEDYFTEVLKEME